MKLFSFALVLALGSASAAAAAGPPWPLPSAHGPALVEQVFSDPSVPIHVRVGQAFLIALDSNHTTGFAWTLAVPPGGAAQAIGSAYEGSSSGRMGAPGKEIWLFIARDAGESRITFRYLKIPDPGMQAGAKMVTFPPRRHTVAAIHGNLARRAANRVDLAWGE